MTVDQRFYEGSLALMQAAVACVMEKCGVTEVSVSREELATALERMNVFWRAGVAVGFTCRIEAPQSAPKPEAPVVQENHPEPNTYPSAERNWAEDMQGEAGAGMCRCLTCGEMFIGLNFRVDCRVCHERAAPKACAAQPPAGTNCCGDPDHCSFVHADCALRQYSKEADHVQEPTPCPECQGSGEGERVLSADPNGYEERYVCGACHGTGIKA